MILARYLSLKKVVRC